MRDKMADCGISQTHTVTANYLAQSIWGTLNPAGPLQSQNDMQNHTPDLFHTYY